MGTSNSELELLAIQADKRVADICSRCPENRPAWILPSIAAAGLTAQLTEWTGTLEKKKPESVFRHLLVIQEAGAIKILIDDLARVQLLWQKTRALASAIRYFPNGALGTSARDELLGFMSERSDIFTSEAKDRVFAWLTAAYDGNLAIYVECQPSPLTVEQVTCLGTWVSTKGRYWRRHRNLPLRDHDKAVSDVFAYQYEKTEIEIMREAALGIAKDKIDRAIILLKYQEGLRQNKIAERLKLSESAVSERLRRIVETLVRAVERKNRK